MRTIALMNTKGGVGKTTCTLNISAALARVEKKVLAVDLDPQANLTRSFGIDPTELKKTIFDVMKADASLSQAIVKLPTIDLLPSNLRLANAELWLSTMRMGRENILKKALKPAESLYDFCLIDCPPNLGNLTTNAMMAATDIIIIVLTDNYSRYGMADLLGQFQEAKEYNPSLRLMGVLANGYDVRNNLDKESLKQLQEVCVLEGKSVLFNTVVGNIVKLAESPAAFQDIFAFDSRSKGANDFMNVAHEVLERVQ